MLEPRENRNLLAHKDTLNKFYSDFKEGKLPHSIIISGNKGIGKTTLIYHFINKILSEENGEEKQKEAMGLFGDALGSSEPDSMEIIEDSETHKKIKAGSHPDLLIIQKEINPKTKKLNKEIKVDQIRKINNFLGLTSGFSKYRFIVIDSADDMNINAANALLKTLEEPPRNSFLFLISHNPGKLLDTIRSRCRIIKVKNLNYNNWRQILELNSEDSKEIKKSLKNETELKALYNLSDGSVSLACELINFSTIELYEQIINLLLNPNTEQKNKLNKKIAHKDFPWSLFIHLITSFLHRAIKFKAINDSNLILISQEKALFEKYSHKDIDTLFEKNTYITNMLNGVKRSNLDSEYVFNLVINELVGLSG